MTDNNVEPLLPYDQPKTQPAVHGGQLSIVSTVFLLCALSLGVGVFLVPTVFGSLGLIAGVGLLLFFGSVSTAVGYFVVGIASDLEVSSMADLAQCIVGDRKAANVLVIYSNISVIITLVTGNAGHLQLVATMMFDLMEVFITGNYGDYECTRVHKGIILAIFLLVVMPYCFISDLSLLKHVGESVSVVVILTCTVVMASCFSRLQTHGADGLAGGSFPLPAAPPDAATLLRLVPTICYTYTSLFTLFPIRSILIASDGPSVAQKRLQDAVLFSGCLQTAIYTSVGVVASITFGTSAGHIVHGHANGNGNILYNFPNHNYPITFLCLCLVVVIVLDYPVIQFPAVEAVLRMLPKERGPCCPSCSSWFGFSARHIVSLCFASIVLAMVVFVPRLEDLFGLCGSLGISGYCYVVPGIVIASKSRDNKSHVGMLFGGFVVVLGVGVFIASTCFVVKHIMQD